VERALKRPILLLAGGAAALYATLSIVRHETFRSTGFDLGIFDQVVWHYSRFEDPASSIRGFENQLGDHFSPVLALLAPLYWVWSDPKALLVAQALLIAASAVPVYLFAEPRIGRLPAHLLTAAYLLFWGIQSAVDFDFHEVAFAPLPIALAVLFADRRRWVPFFVAIAFLLLVKEDLSLLVAAFGVYLLTLRAWVPGVVTAAAGVAWFFIATDVLMPHFAGHDYKGFWTYTQLGEDVPDAVWNSIRHPTLPFRVFFDPAEKVGTMALLFGAFLGLTLCSRLVILTLPLLGERMLSTSEHFWETDAHYSLTIAPILAMGAAAGLAFLCERVPVLRERRGRVQVGATAAMVAIAVGLCAAFPLRDLADPDSYETRAAYRNAEQSLARVPSDASVAATNCLVPHLSQRDRAYLLGFGRYAPPDYLVVALPEEEKDCLYPLVTEARLRAGLAVARAAYRTIDSEDGLIVMRRRGRQPPRRR
jgi:uncharacterized membrane protein